jgi:lipoprotein-anchoring transpeptidase ErfK/SrfK
MSTNVLEARQYIVKAREALHRGDKQSAWQWGKRAVLAAPKMEDAWLILAAADPNAQDALAYARKALEVNPTSTRARRGLEWAVARVKQANVGNALVEKSTNASFSMGRRDALATLPKPISRGTIPSSQSKINKRNWLYPAILIGAGCLMVGLVGFFALTSPVLASILSNVSAPVPTQENLWASVDIAKPTIAPNDGNLLASRSELQDIPSVAAPEDPIVVPQATETPGTVVMEVVDDNSLGQSVPPDEARIPFPAEGNGERWIDVNLSEQRVYAYEGDVVVNSFLVSTGVAETPTVTGEYQIYVKVRIQDMSGPGYYLPDVPWVMYFYEEYGFHGTYWHNNFGTPMSRGCVNMRIDDAAWLYDWASVGTAVNVHY